MIKCVMFDFDDTLYDFSTAIKNTIFQLIKKSGLNYNNAKSFLYDIRVFYCNMFKKINELSENTSNYNVSKEFITNAFDYYLTFSQILNNYSKINIERKEFYDIFFQFCVVDKEAKKLISWLNTNDIKICILSDGLLNDKITLLEKFGLLSYINCIITSDQISSIKPSENFFESAISKLNLKCNECIYVGNHRSDYIMSVRSNVKFILYRPDMSFADRLIENIPEVKHLFDIIAFVKMIWYNKT